MNAPEIRMVRARMVGQCGACVLETGAVILAGMLGIAVGSTTLSPPANDGPAVSA